MDALDTLCTKLLKRPRTVLATWLVLGAISVPFAPRLVDRCKFAFEPVPGTPTFRAQQIFLEDFPGDVNQDVEIVMISCDQPCPAGIPSLPFAADASVQLGQRCTSLAAGHPGLVENWTDYFQFQKSAPGRLGAPSPFLSASNQTLLFQVSLKVNKDRQVEVQGLLEELRDLVRSLDRTGKQLESGAVSVQLTGSLALFSDTLASTKRDIEQKDVMVIPFAMFVLAWRVKSWRLLLLPLMCLVCSLAIALALFFPLAAYVVDISPLAPSTMAFLSVALAIDYSLFMLTRYVEEARAGKSTEEALRATMRHSGHVVVISGFVLIICYCGVLCYPSGGISTIGLGAAMAVILCVATNLTLTPCAIAAFPGFFGAEVIRARGDRGLCCRRISARSAARASLTKGCWPRIANAVTRMPGVLLVPILSLGMLLPACFALLHYRESFANTLTFPSRSEASLAYQHIGREFSAGQLNPQYVLLQAEPNASVRSDEYFEASCDVAQRLLKRLSGPPFEIRPRHLLGLAVLPKPSRARMFPLALGETEEDESLACLRWSSNVTDDLHPFGDVTAEKLLQIPGDVGEAYREQWQKLVSVDRGERSALILITVPFDPYSDTLRPFVSAAREALAGSKEEGLLRISEMRSNSRPRSVAGTREPVLFGTLTTLCDVVDVTYQRLPYILVGTVILVFSLVAIAFQSALAPVKMFFTVVVPLAAVFGVAVWVYQDGVLDFLPGGPGGNPFTSPPGGGFYWGTPVFTCTIIIGLALDYDIFLFARVLELRRKGFNNGAAVRGALCLTGPVITCAGLIMAIAFCGLMLSDVPTNNQIGFVMAFGVLLDTFVIRTCLVPSVLTLAASANYWPQQLPPVSRGDVDELLLLDEDGCLDGDGARVQSNLEMDSSQRRASRS